MHSGQRAPGDSEERRLAKCERLMRLGDEWGSILLVSLLLSMSEFSIMICFLKHLPIVKNRFKK